MIVLGGGNDIRNGRLRLPFRNLPRANLVRAIEKALAILRGNLQNRQRAGQHVLDGVAQVQGAALPGVRIGHAGRERGDAVRERRREPAACTWSG